ncbi:MAG: hypothetical protein YHS30scaffold667_18 [Phage 65_10]|nr:MAG: hypothetical protein YHS30scaffold667_18 [Phage 65_10]
MRIKANPTFTTPVKLTIRGQEALAEIQVTWKHKDRDAVKEWMRRPLRATDDGIVLVEVEAAYLMEVMDSWDGPENEAGDKVPLTDKSLADMLREHHTSGQEFYQQYLNALAESRVKN